jgi:hypothetical protein
MHERVFIIEDTRELPQDIYIFHWWIQNSTINICNLGVAYPDQLSSYHHKMSGFYYWSVPLFIFLFLICLHKGRGREVRSSDPRFMKCGS